ncbi:MAG: transporter substrate-binding domain-containing protein [Alphaproteobacteria bacterium]|nr:transporter substrate-binding domain-containing protein [Alphaproteobacteria bacterium]
MKQFLFLLIVLLSASSSAHAAESTYDRVIAKNEIVCGVAPWAPYKEYDPNTKEWKGFAIEIYKRAFATLDIKVTFKEVILGAQVQDLNNGNVDAICDDGPWTMSSGKFVEYSDPLYASIVFPYVRKGDARFKTRADLNKADIKFTGIDGDLSSDLVRRLFPQAQLATMPGNTDVSQLYLNVATKKADIVIADPGSFSAYNETNPGQLVPLFKDTPLGRYKTVISVKKGDVKMLGLVNQAVDNALAFGIADEILDGFDPTHDKLARVRSRFVTGQ